MTEQAAESSQQQGGRSTLESAALCGFYASGIIFFLVIYGLLQEQIMTQPYGDPPLYFRDSVFLVLCNRLVAVVFAMVMVTIKGESFVNNAPLWKYLAISVSNVYASVCQYEALKFVTFPVQMLGKSFKMMPVMVWGIIVSGKQYGATDWLIAAAVTGGVTEFLMTGPISSHGGSNSSTGLMLLACFLLLDGFTSTFQEKLFKDYTTSKYNQMLYINSGSVCVSLASLYLGLMPGSTLASSIAFAKAHPSLMWDAGTLSGAAVAGQWFIYSQVKEFGALVFAATMNVRQVVSIIVSYVKYGHSITPLQIVGLFMVFAALFYKSYLGLVSEPEEKKPLIEKKIGFEDDKASESNKTASSA